MPLLASRHHLGPAPSARRAWIALALSAALGASAGAASPRAWAEEAGPAPGVAPTPPATLESLEAAFQGDPTDLCAGLALQDAQGKAWKPDAVLRWFKRYAEGRAADRVAEFLLGRAEGSEAGLSSMWSAVLARLGRVEGDDRGLTEAWDALIEAEEQAGRDDRVVAALERRVALGPTVLLWLRLGWARERLSQWKEAEQAYRKAQALDAKAVAPANALALALARQGRHGEAQKVAKATTDREPGSAQAWLHQGMVLALAGRREQAAQSYAKASELAGRDAATLAALSASYAEIEEYALAEKALAAALALDPANLTAQLQAATVALQRDQLPEARRALSQAARLAPRHPDVAFLQGVVAERSNQQEQALTAYRKALSLSPGSAVYANALAALLIERGSYENALEVLEDAVKASPKDAGLRMRMGFCALKRRRWSQAKEAFGAAAALSPKDPDPHLYLAVVLGDHEGDDAGALDQLTQYQQLGGRAPSALAWLRQLQAAAPKK